MNFYTQHCRIFYYQCTHNCYIWLHIEDKSEHALFLLYVFYKHILLRFAEENSNEHKKNTLLIFIHSKQSQFIHKLFIEILIWEKSPNENRTPNPLVDGQFNHQIHIQRIYITSSYKHKHINNREPPLQSRMVAQQHYENMVGAYHTCG